MISNEILAYVDTEEKLEMLFAAFGFTKIEGKIEFIEKITNHKIGNCGVRSQDLEDTKDFFLKHEWQGFA